MLLRAVLLTASIGCLAVALTAQAPEGWRVRIDTSQSAQDPDDTPELKFVTVTPSGARIAGAVSDKRVEKGFHVTAGPAGTFWNPANTVSGDFTATATFTLLKPSPHVNYYGLVFGGADLDRANQHYLYFLIAQNGTFVVRRRTGEKVEDVQPRTPHATIRQPQADGRSTNTLEVRVDGKTISYAVNGAVVHTTSKSGLTAKTDGIVGFRVNHLLDVQIEGFDVVGWNSHS